VLCRPVIQLRFADVHDPDHPDRSDHLNPGAGPRPTSDRRPGPTTWRTWRRSSGSAVAATSPPRCAGSGNRARS